MPPCGDPGRGLFYSMVTSWSMVVDAWLDPRVAASSDSGDRDADAEKVLCANGPAVNRIFVSLVLVCA